MRWGRVERLAKALLYEGYLLFPYSRSSLKNRARVSFGELGPLGSAGRTSQSSELLVQATDSATIHARIAFLQPMRTRDGGAGSPGWTEVREQVFERSFELGAEARFVVEAPATEEAAPIAAQLTVEVAFEVAAVSDGVHRLRCALSNVTPLGGDQPILAVHSAHVALVIEEGSFVSAIDPPAALQRAADGCESDGAWPVLVGRDGRCVLLSPIILCDDPRIAGESPDDLFDMTENDELLTLAILALTDDERAKMAAADPRAAALLTRVDADPRSRLAGLHGTLRGFRGVDAAGEPRVRVGTTFVGVGDAVRLRPAGRDADDVWLDGKTGLIVEIAVDVEGREQAVVVLDDDPGRELGLEGVGVGHRFYVDAAELEALGGPP